MKLQFQVSLEQGSYSLKGRYDASSRKIILKSLQWIKKPRGYGMAGMTIPICEKQITVFVLKMWETINWIVLF